MSVKLEELPVAFAAIQREFRAENIGRDMGAALVAAVNKAAADNGHKVVYNLFEPICDHLNEASSSSSSDQ